MDTYTNKQKKQLFEKINTLSKTEHAEIFKILKKFNTSNDNLLPLTKNKNGLFFNLSIINDELYDDINNFVTYSFNNKKNLDDYDKKINECKINNNFTNIIHINFDKMPKQEQEQPDWNNVVTEYKSVQKIANYIEKMLIDREKVGKKKMNVKFNNARKKYAKKIINEKKFDYDGFKDLEYEQYIT